MMIIRGTNVKNVSVILKSIINAYQFPNSHEYNKMILEHSNNTTGIVSPSTTQTPDDGATMTTSTAGPSVELFSEESFLLILSGTPSSFLLLLRLLLLWNLLSKLSMKSVPDEVLDLAIVLSYLSEFGSKISLIVSIH